MRVGLKIIQKSIRAGNVSECNQRFLGGIEKNSPLLNQLLAYCFLFIIIIFAIGLSVSIRHQTCRPHERGAAHRKNVDTPSLAGWC